MLKEKGQKDKQRYTEHYIENIGLSNTNPTKIRGWIHVLQKGR